MAFFDKVERLCIERGVSVDRMAKEIGRSGAAASRWRYGAVPYKSTVKAIADYFGVTVDYLMSDEEPSPTQWDSKLESEEYLPLSSSEKFILDMWRELDETGQSKFMLACLHRHDIELCRMKGIPNPYANEPPYAMTPPEEGNNE